MKFQDIDVG